MSSETSVPNVPAELAIVPFGRLSRWMLPAAWTTLAIAGIASFVACNGDLVEFAIDVVFNPLIWLVAFWFWRCNKIKCPHCGKLADIQANVAIGESVSCAFCHRDYAKPPI